MVVQSCTAHTMSDVKETTAVKNKTFESNIQWSPSQPQEKEKRHVLVLCG
eukprot:m.184364 g.184364  ORF g.184364 m.184364 type:complete len:50 (-) comp15011_c0_seq3:2160-2309(-)